MADSETGLPIFSGDEMRRRKMRAYGARESGGKYILDDYEFSRNHIKSVTIRRWKRNLKKKARAATRRLLHELS